MRKIPTLFVRDPADRAHVLPEVTPGCEWVLAGEGVPTRKYDGTCVMFDGTTWWARREVKPGKAEPQNFRREEHDEATGKTVGWVPMDESDWRKWHAEALSNLTEDQVGWDVGTYELVGPKINGNPERRSHHALIRHADAGRLLEPDLASYERIRETALLYAKGGWEGFVWHHPDGRMAKIKGRDFQ